MKFDKSKFIGRFIEDSQDHIQKLNEGLLHLEKNPDDEEILNAIFRSAHTIKGSSRMMKQTGISTIAHKLEDALDAVRQGKIRISKDITGIYFKGIDAIGKMLERVSKGEDIVEAPQKISDLLDAVISGEYKVKSKPKFEKSQLINRFIEDAQEHIKKLNAGLLKLEKQPDDQSVVDEIFRSAHTIKGSSRMMNFKTISDVAHRLEDELDDLRQGKKRISKEATSVYFQFIDTLEDFLKRASTGDEIPDVPQDLFAKLSALSETPRQQNDSEHLKKEVARQNAQVEDIQAEHASSVETIRVGEDKLDELIRLMGEIVSNYNRIKQIDASLNQLEKMFRTSQLLVSKDCQKEGYLEYNLPILLQNINNQYEEIKKIKNKVRETANTQELLTYELQDRSLKLRMLPLSTIFDQFPRTVHDLAHNFNKDIEFKVEGADTELDKKIIQKLSDPLIHMIRNSIDHGIESEQDRLADGKPVSGTIQLNASYEGGTVRIDCMDDGAGISVDRIKAKAIKMGLITDRDIESVSETEILNLIFKPGFSTSEFITDISGRGVGMDVVWRNICTDLKGSIQIQTKLGKGTQFCIRVPLTMAIMHVLMVQISKMNFAIPSTHIAEIVKVNDEEIIDVVDKKAIRLREQFIPVVNLAEVLEVPNFTHTFTKEKLILITSMGSELIGLIIDKIIQAEDRTIKPLPKHLRKLEMVSGVTITGGDEINCVLHIPAIFNAIKETKRKFISPKEQQKQTKKMHILVVDDSISTREIEKSILESYGYQVSLASDGAEALEIIQDNTFDLVISDIEMPRLDGFSLTQKIREDSAVKHIPIILLSSRDKNKDKLRGLQVGANAYIVKGGFDQNNLLETIQSLVG